MEEMKEKIGNNINNNFEILKLIDENDSNYKNIKDKIDKNNKLYAEIIEKIKINKLKDSKDLKGKQSLIFENLSYQIIILKKSFKENQNVNVIFYLFVSTV